MTKKNRKHVVITNTNRGVYFAEIESSPAKDGTLECFNVRHCFSWKCDPAYKGVWGLAIVGPQQGSQIGPVVKKMTILNVSCIAECEPVAVEAWKAATWE